MGLAIARCLPTDPSRGKAVKAVPRDGGFYSYYAGPVYTPSGVDMTKRCIDISGWIDWRNRTLTKRHCG
jgi:hypothetical protein